MNESNKTRLKVIRTKRSCQSSSRKQKEGPNLVLVFAVCSLFPIFPRLSSSSRQSSPKRRTQIQKEKRAKTTGSHRLLLPFLILLKKSGWITQPLFNCSPFYIQIALGEIPPGPKKLSHPPWNPLPFNWKKTQSQEKASITIQKRKNDLGSSNSRLEEPPLTTLPERGYGWHTRP